MGVMDRGEKSASQITSGMICTLYDRLPDTRCFSALIYGHYHRYNAWE